jgi:hypothetical protein
MMVLWHRWSSTKATVARIIELEWQTLQPRWHNQFQDGRTVISAFNVGDGDDEPKAELAQSAAQYASHDTDGWR